MSLQRIVKSIAVAVTTGFVLATTALTSYADGCGSCVTGTCGTSGCCSQNGCCPCGPCPPPLVHCTPKVPKIKYKCVCGKPICDPCDLEGYGYNPTCWRPWIPPLSCCNLGVPALGCAPPVAQIPVNIYQPSTADLTPPANSEGTTLPLPQKMPKDLTPPNR
jgi:hypothetical protein